MFQSSFIHLLYYPQLLSISCVKNVTDIYRPHVVISTLWELDFLSLSFLIKLIYVQSIHAFVILILSYSNGLYFSGVFASCRIW
jgi:uncharacterized protein with PQ loop repeat